ncbi:OsmC family protein [Propionibacteriaceae bacterium Y1700]|uniref:OsmC family protein n=1 Tax=Microlunatus sp. Y1700 TaxID=3418487 RepID=UPI003DA70C7A
MAKGQSQARLERIGHGTYRATNGRGGEIVIGDGAGVDFTPGELLMAAIAGCSAIDVDHIVSQRAEPEEFVATSSGRKVTDQQGNHFVDLAVEFDLSFPDTEDGARAEAVVQRSIDQSRDRLCTVGRTVQIGTPVSIQRTGAP